MDTVAVIAVVGVLAAVGHAAAVVHPIPVGSGAVVTRSGVPLRSKAGGLIAAIPVVEHVHMVATHPRRIDPMAVHVITQDGVEVHLILSILFRVENPRLSVQSTVDERAITTDAIERALHHLAGQSILVDLLLGREAILASVSAEASKCLEPSGLELVDIDLLGTEVRVGAQLLHLITDRGGPGAIQSKDQKHA